MRRSPGVHNKHWIGKRASLKSLKRYCKEIWAELIKERDGHRCVLCEATKFVQAHHIITKRFAPTRYEENCGISLCAKCHSMGLVSAHQSPYVIYEWMEENRPDQYKWFLENKDGIRNPPELILNLQFYRDILKKLLDRFEEIAPQKMKTCKYNRFAEAEENSICVDYTEKMLSRRDLAMKYEATEQVIETILKRRGVEMRRVGVLSKELKNLKNKLNYEGYDEPTGNH